MTPEKALFPSRVAGEGVTLEDCFLEPSGAVSQSRMCRRHLWRRVLASPGNPLLSTLRVCSDSQFKDWGTGPAPLSLRTHWTCGWEKGLRGFEKSYHLKEQSPFIPLLGVGTFSLPCKMTECQHTSKEGLTSPSADHHSRTGTRFHLSIFSSSPGLQCHFLLYETFPIQGLRLHLLHWQADSLPLSHLGSPLENIRDCINLIDCLCNYGIWNTSEFWLPNEHFYAQCQVYEHFLQRDL